MPVTRLQLRNASPEDQPLVASNPSQVILEGPQKLRVPDPTSHLRRTGISVKVRRSVYYLLTGMLIYLLSWSSVLCRVTRGIVQYPDRMPTAVWVSTLGILLFYETFIIAQCTSMAARVRQIMAAQRVALEPRRVWSEKDTQLPNVSSCTVMRAFYVQASALGRKRDTFYLMLLHFLSMPDWESIAFLAGGATIDLVTAVLYSVPFFRDELFGLPEEQQRAEPWATMAFLLLVWLITVSLSALWEKHRHRKQRNSDIETTENEESLWDFDKEADRDTQIDQQVASQIPSSVDRSWQIGRVPCLQPLQWLESKALECFAKAEKKVSSKPDKSSEKDDGLLHTFQGLSVPAKLVIAFLIYGIAGGLIFLGWGFVMKLWIEESALPWMLVLATLAVLLFYRMYQLGKWRLYVHHDETPHEQDAPGIVARMQKFSQYHATAGVFHLLLVGMSLFLGSLNSDLEWRDDYLYLKRPAYFLTADWERVSDLQDDNATKADLLAAAANSSDPFLGMQGATTPKISIGYCATSYPLPVYFLFVCIGWSVCSMLQHLMSWHRIKHFQSVRTMQLGWTGTCLCC